MIQIIGFLGCLYLLVKALEIASSSAFKDQAGSVDATAKTAIALAVAGAVGFAIWLLAQGGAFAIPDPASTPDASIGEMMSQSKVECINNAKSQDQVLACK